MVEVEEDTSLDLELEVYPSALPSGRSCVVAEVGSLADIGREVELGNAAVGVVAEAASVVAVQEEGHWLLQRQKIGLRWRPNP